MANSFRRKLIKGSIYSSSTQHSSPRGWDHFFSSADSFQSNDNKATGFPVRCIRD
ncbi:MAG: hypothetical protein Q8M08_12760 [Bacteroidales bacterium]|nr:hypothetical protein [Bacteroidales bacterium]